MSAPRIRSIKPEMWEDEKVGALSHEARLLAVVLVTMADDEGRLRAGPGVIIGRGYPYDQDAVPPRVTPAKLAAWFAEIVESGMVVAYESGGLPYAAFRHWRRHQRIQRPRASVLPPPPDPAVVRANAIPNTGASPDASGTHHGTIREGYGTAAGVVGDSDVLPRVPVRSGPDPVVVVEQIDARAALDSLGEGPEADRLRETVEILATSRRLTLDVELTGVANMLAAHPDGDHRRAAHMAVAAAADPAYRTTSGARALGYAFDELARTAARMPAPSPVDEREATAARRLAAATRVYGGERAA